MKMNLCFMFFDRLILSPRSLHFAFVSNYFSLCFSDWIISIDLFSSSAVSNFLLNSSSNCFSHFIYCDSLVLKSHLIFKIFSISLIVFPHLFSYCDNIVICLWMYTYFIIYLCLLKCTFLLIPTSWSFASLFQLTAFSFDLRNYLLCLHMPSYFSL